MQFDFPRTQQKLSTHYLANSLEDWSDMICRQFTDLTMDEQPGSRFQGELRSKEIGQLQFNEVRAAGQVVSRRRNNIVHGLTDQIFLIYQRKGVSSAIINDDDCIKVRAGDAYMISPQEPYTLMFDQPSEQICIQIPCNEIRKRFSSNVDVTANRMIEGSTSIAKILSASLDDLAKEEVACEQDAFHSVELFCDVIANCIRRADTSNEVFWGDSHSRKFKELANFILNNYKCDTLCMLDAANELGVSSRSLSRMCYDHGTTFRQLLLRTRLNIAANSLKNYGHTSNGNITRIAYNSGFSDLSHFSKTFKTLYGVSPKDFLKA